MVCDCNVSGVCPQPEITLSCPAKVMQPRQRQDLALQTLAGTDTISGLAAHHEVKHLGREWRRDDGAAMRIERCLADANSTKDQLQKHGHIWLVLKRLSVAGFEAPSHISRWRSDKPDFPRLRR